MIFGAGEAGAVDAEGLAAPSLELAPDKVSLLIGKGRCDSFRRSKSLPLRAPAACSGTLMGCKYQRVLRRDALEATGARRNIRSKLSNARSCLVRVAP